MARPRLSNSTRKFLRKEKARIRRQTLDSTEAEKNIQKLIISSRKPRL